MRRFKTAVQVFFGVLLGGAGCLMQLVISGFFIVLSVTVFFFFWGLVFGGADSDVDVRRYSAFVAGVNSAETTNDRIQTDAILLAIPLLDVDNKGVDELQRVSEVYGNATDALRENRARAAQLEPEAVQQDVHALLLEVLDTDLKVYERLIELFQEGLRRTQAGENWTVPDDPETNSLIARSERLRAELNAAKVQVEREVGLLD